ncbi:hypothetical protein HK100_001098 [Physocladia obscura]|uniref:SAM domain-containing protein n=1 Tax=Physocladia obscura TaxID=109957 RepID=A0AAD5XC28_9FUNG|nr:hypothetical protein HK100_001098 [Physocladia obscura]
MTNTKSNTTDTSSKLTWLEETFYGAGSGICSSSDLAVLDYTIVTDCSADNSCSVGTYGQSSSGCISSASLADLLTQTSEEFGEGVQFVEINWYLDYPCKTLYRASHYRVNTCVYASATDDNSNSYQYVYNAAANSLRSLRYSDTSCQAQISSPNAYNFNLSIPAGSCDVSQTLWNSYMAVSIVYTVAVPSAGSNSVSVFAIVGGVVGGVVFLAAVVTAVFCWRRKKQDKTYSEIPLSSSPLDNGNDVLLNPASQPQNNKIYQPEYGSFNNRASIFSSGNSSSNTITNSSQSINAVANPVSVPNISTVGAIYSEKANRSLFDGNILSNANNPLNNQRTQNIHAVRGQIMDLKLPPSPADWSVADAAKWISNVGGGVECLDLMQEHEIDGKCLLVIQSEQLFSALKITAIGRQTRLLEKLEMLKQMNNENAANNNNNEGTSETDALPPAYQPI